MGQVLFWCEMASVHLACTELFCYLLWLGVAGRSQCSRCSGCSFSTVLRLSWSSSCFSWSETWTQHCWAGLRLKSITIKAGSGAHCGKLISAYNHHLPCKTQQFCEQGFPAHSPLRERGSQFLKTRAKASKLPQSYLNKEHQKASCVNAELLWASVSWGEPIFFASQIWLSAGGSSTTSMRNFQESAEPGRSKSND